MIAKRWAQILLHCPCIIMLLWICASGAMAYRCFYRMDLPDFSNPILGFATRGTDISDRALTYELMRNATKEFRFSMMPSWPRDRRSFKSASVDDDSEVSFNNVPNNQYGFGNRAKRDGAQCRSAEVFNKSGRLIFRLDAFDAAAFGKLCRAEEILREKGAFSNDYYCTKEGYSCCPPQHLARTLSRSVGEEDCSRVSVPNRRNLMESLRLCFNGRDIILKTIRANKLLPHGLQHCGNEYYLEAVHHLLPVAFEDEQFSVMVLPYMDMHHHRPINVEKMNELVSALGDDLLGMNVGLKEKLFVDKLKYDIECGFVSLFLVCLVLLVSTRSPFFSLAVILNILMAMIGAYYVYRVVFRIEFFPFINLLAAAMLIGIGADDAFVLRQCWHEARAAPIEAPMAKLIEYAVQKSFLPMMVTSATTVFALLANIVSHTTAIKCFGVFGSLCLVLNFILVLTWIPACIVFFEKCSIGIASVTPGCAGRALQAVKEQCRGVLRIKEYILCALMCGIASTVTKFKYLVIFLFTSAFLFSCYVTFYDPGVRLPSHNYYQYFRDSSIYEKYDNTFKELLEDNVDTSPTLVMYYLFGVKKGKSRGWFTPKGSDPLEILSEEEFELTNLNEIIKLNEVCKRIERSPFIVPPKQDLLAPSYCLTDKFLLYLSMPCTPTRQRCCVQRNASNILHESVNEVKNGAPSERYDGSAFDNLVPVLPSRRKRDRGDVRRNEPLLHAEVQSPDSPKNFNGANKFASEIRISLDRFKRLTGMSKKRSENGIKQKRGRREPKDKNGIISEEGSKSEGLSMKFFARRHDVRSESERETKRNDRFGREAANLGRRGETGRRLRREKRDERIVNRIDVQDCLERFYFEYRNHLDSFDSDRNLEYPTGRFMFLSDSSNRYAVHFAGFLTNLTFTMEHLPMKRNFKIFNEINDDAMQNATEFLRKGFWVSDAFSFFDLQASLLDDTLISLAISLVLTFVVLFLSIRSVGVSLIAVFAIFDIMISMISVLILLGWELNVVEETIVLLIVGLSFDFVLHYAVAFSRSMEVKRADKTLKSITEVIYPVTMATLTTFVTGVGMVFAATLSFYQIGLFMMLISSIGWIVSTIFFTSLLSAIGPEVNLCCPSKRAVVLRRDSRVSRTEGALEKPLLESSPHFPVVDLSTQSTQSSSHSPVDRRRSYASPGNSASVRRASMPVAFSNPPQPIRWSVSPTSRRPPRRAFGQITSKHISLRNDPIFGTSESINSSDVPEC